MFDDPKNNNSVSNFDGSRKQLLVGILHLMNNKCFSYLK